MYADMIEYVKKYFDNTDNPRSKFDTKYPFRNNFDHCVRVYNWALRINRLEKADENIVAIASIFHDVGKAYNMEISHAEISADVCKAYLKKLQYPEYKILRIVQAIKVHPFKEDTNIHLYPEDKILMDADLLDEVGALTAVWDSMATALEARPDYLKVYNRSLKFYNKVASKREVLKTPTGRAFYDERLKFLNSFIENLGFELGIDLHKER